MAQSWLSKPILSSWQRRWLRKICQVLPGESDGSDGSDGDRQFLDPENTTSPATHNGNHLKPTWTKWFYHNLPNSNSNCQNSLKISHFWQKPEYVFSNFLIHSLYMSIICPVYPAFSFAKTQCLLVNSSVLQTLHDSLIGLPNALSLWGKVRSTGSWKLQKIIVE